MLNYILYLGEKYLDTFSYFGYVLGFLCFLFFGEGLPDVGWEFLEGWNCRCVSAVSLGRRSSFWMAICTGDALVPVGQITLPHQPYIFCTICLADLNIVTIVFHLPSVADYVRCWGATIGIRRVFLWATLLLHIRAGVRKSSYWMAICTGDAIRIGWLFD